MPISSLITTSLDIDMDRCHILCLLGITLLLLRKFQETSGLVADEFLMLSTSDFKVEFVVIDKDPPQSVSGLGPLEDVSAHQIDYDASNQKIFWADKSDNVIRVRGIQGSPRRDILKGFADLAAVAVDWVSNLLYFSDQMTGIVGVASLDGQYSVTIAEGIEVTSLALDPGTSSIYWIDKKYNNSSDKARITTASMDGTNQLTWQKVADTDELKGLVVDVQHPKVVYWAQHYTGWWTSGWKVFPLLLVSPSCV
jgi:hypothetical protein